VCCPTDEPLPVPEHPAHRLHKSSYHVLLPSRRVPCRVCSGYPRYSLYTCFAIGCHYVICHDCAVGRAHIDRFAASGEDGALKKPRAKKQFLALPGGAADRADTPLEVADASRVAHVKSNSLASHMQLLRDSPDLLKGPKWLVAAWSPSSGASTSSAAASSSSASGPSVAHGDQLMEILLGASNWCPSEYHCTTGYEIDLAVLDVREEWNGSDPVTLQTTLNEGSRRHSGQHSYANVHFRRMDVIDLARTYPAMYEQFLHFLRSDPPQETFFPFLNAMFYNRRMCHAYHTRAIYVPALLAMQPDYRAGRIPHSALLALQLSRPPLMSNELASIARHLNPHGLLDEMSEWWLFSQPPRCEKLEFDPADWREILTPQSSLATAEARAAEGLPALPDPALLREPGHYTRNSPNRIAPYDTDAAHMEGLVDALRAKAYISPVHPPHPSFSLLSSAAAGLASSTSLFPPSDPAGMPAVPERWILPQEIVVALQLHRPDLTPSAVESFRAGYVLQWSNHEAAALDQLARRAAYIGSHTASSADAAAAIAALYAAPVRVLPLRLLPPQLSALGPPFLLPPLLPLLSGGSLASASGLSADSLQLAAKQESSAAAAASSWSTAVGSRSAAAAIDATGAVVRAPQAHNPWTQAEQDALDSLLQANPSRNNATLAKLLLEHHRTPGANHPPFPFRSEKSVSKRVTKRRHALQLYSSVGRKVTPPKAEPKVEPKK
jgi:hypothetical protein